MMKTKGPSWKAWIRRAEKIVVKVKEHDFGDFNVKWLADLTGVIEWVQARQYITGNMKRAIDNTGRAVAQMIRYKKLKEKRRGNTQTAGRSERDQTEGSDP